MLHGEILGNFRRYKRDRRIEFAHKKDVQSTARSFLSLARSPWNGVRGTTEGLSESK